MVCGFDFCDYIVAFILPPLAVALENGCGADLLINICLTILGWIPGFLHACYVVHESHKAQRTTV